MNEKSLVLTATILSDLQQRWDPHRGQHTVLYDLFVSLIKDFFVECGRKWGKTELLIYLLWRFALFNRNAGCYYIAPFQKQAKEIVWATRRIQTFMPQKYIKSINNTEMRITTVFGSFIKVDGSDNHESYRGIEPHILGYDEIKDHAPEFHVAMNPNRSVYDAPLVIIGTPPEAEGHYTDIRDEFKKDPDKRYYNFPSWTNPHISKEWLAKERKSLLRRGDADIWKREYEAKFIIGGKNHIFQMLDKKHFLAHDKLMKLIEKDKHKFNYYVTADPGTTTCFCVLFICINQYNRKIYVLDEIYETSQMETSTSKIIKRVRAKREEYAPLKSWYNTYDEAAAWFWTEVSTLGIDESWTPTDKAVHKRDVQTKEPWGISLIKDILSYDKILISSLCKNLRSEMENYIKVKTRDGSYQVPKSRDHAIDCLRYTLASAFYTLPEKMEPEEPLEPERRRTYSIEEDLAMDELFPELRV